MAAEHPYPARRFGGRGIVICAGGVRMVTCAWVAINVLRRTLGCTLPIELWHIGPRELSSFEAALFRPLDVEVVDAQELTARWPARNLGGWELKAYALVHSRFAQVLLLDADNVAVRDPEYLFGSPQFAETGTIAWPDLVRISSANPIWELCGVAFRDEPAWESGQLLIDKTRCWHALQIALEMNMHSEVFYPHTHGDKDTFHVAWIMAGRAWAMPDAPARLTATGLVQRDVDGDVIFQHRSIAKWRLVGENPANPDFRHEADCHRYISELRERWSGLIAPLPEPSEADLRTEDELAGVRWFRLREHAGDERLLELLPDNQIGIGRTRQELLRWYVRAGALTMDGALAVLPPMTAVEGTRFVSGDASRPLELIPAPAAGQDTVGLTAAAVLEQFATDPELTAEATLTTILTLARMCDLNAALLRAQRRWQDNGEVLRLIERALDRLGPRQRLVDPEMRGFEPIA